MFPFPAFSTPLPEDGFSGSATRPDPPPEAPETPSRGTVNRPANAKAARFTVRFGVYGPIPPPLGGVGSTPNRAQRVRRQRSGATLDACQASVSWGSTSSGR